MTDTRPNPIDTSRPAVALVIGPTRRHSPRICCGYWQEDGAWADIPVAAVGLADAIREEIERSTCTVICQSFTGAISRPFHYNALSPGADGAIVLPIDPERGGAGEASA